MDQPRSQSADRSQSPRGRDRAAKCGRGCATGRTVRAGASAAPRSEPAADRQQTNLERRDDAVAGADCGSADAVSAAAIRKNRGCFAAAVPSQDGGSNVSILGWIILGLIAGFIASKI